MCNCGNKRLHYSNQQEYSTTAENIGHTAYFNFEYVGKTALTITGNVTGKSYRFYRHGDIQPIDSRDMKGMMGIQVLRRRNS